MENGLSTPVLNGGTFWKQALKPSKNLWSLVEKISENQIPNPLFFQKFCSFDFKKQTPIKNRFQNVEKQTKKNNQALQNQPFPQARLISFSKVKNRL